MFQNTPKTFVLILFFLVSATTVFSQENQLTKPPIESPWAALVNKDLPHQEYPRPQMVRENWLNLNGQWDFAILTKGAEIPNWFDGKITVPFPVESQLSGVGLPVGKEKELWYSKIIEVPASLRKGRVLIHFGAVDWESEVFVNGKSAGIHQGGYDPFSYDITPYLIRGTKQKIQVRVWDPSNDGPQPIGKQRKDPHAIWYTPVTGIWQTVWLEGVPQTFIQSIKNTPDWDNGRILVETNVIGAKPSQSIHVVAKDGGKIVAEQTVSQGENVTLNIPDPKSWSPDSPFLYDLEISIKEGNRTVDQVGSYAALRKISMKVDAAGNQRMMLNDQFIFQYGPLDQGWWPDGLYTAPTEEALLFDIVKTKEMGFNMIRKHVKVEPARWYYHCDKLGMLVWQDMPNGDHGNHWESRPGIIGKGTDKIRTPESEKIFRDEWKAIMEANYNFPSIVVWVPFNEAWGQFKTKEIAAWTKQLDPTRLVNSASGGNFEMEGTKIAGDIMDLHNYPDAVMPDPEIYGKDQIIVLGEFGGLGLPVEGHTWQEKDNWGYQSFKTKEELGDRYAVLMADLEKLIAKGLSAAVYTQTTDVEVEINGLMTYDRKVIKFDIDMLKKLHDKLYKVKVDF